MSIEISQQEQEQFAKAKKLHEQLERSGAYKKIPDRRGAQLLQAYLPTQITLEEASQTLEKPVSISRAGRILRRGMQQAFPFLDEATRQEYGSPDAALRSRTRVNVIQAIKRGHAEAIQAYREGTYTGKPLGGRREPGLGKTIGRPRTRTGRR